MNIKPKIIYKRLVFILGLCYNIIKGGDRHAISKYTMGKINWG